MSLLFLTQQYSASEHSNSQHRVRKDLPIFFFKRAKQSKLTKHIITHPCTNKQKTVGKTQNVYTVCKLLVNSSEILKGTLKTTQ